MHGYRTANKVVLSPVLYESLVDRLLTTERLAVELRKQADEQQMLLFVALHDLARERGAHDRAHFVRQWLQEHRNQEPPIPLRATQEQRKEATTERA